MIDSAPSRSSYRPMMALPPFHTKCLSVLMIYLIYAGFPTLKEIDHYATMETFTRPASKNFIFASPYILGLTRLAFAALIFSTSAYVIKTVAFSEQPIYLSGSKCRPTVLHFSGIKTQFWFTKWTWNLLGLAFLLSGLIPLLPPEHVHPWMLRVALLAFETAVPNTLIVSLTVTYALWPTTYKKHGPKATVKFSQMSALIQHNFNIMMVFLEIGLMGNIPVVMQHLSIPSLYSTIYVFFGWFMAYRWTSVDKGPQFIYFYADTTLGAMTSIILACFLGAFLVFYYTVSVGRAKIFGSVELEEGGVLWRMFCVIGLCFFSSKWQDENVIKVKLLKTV